MSSDKTSSAGGGIGFFGLLAIVFITLKLCGQLDWSWWWVLAPLWGPPAFIVALAVVVGVAWGLLVAGLALVEFVAKRIGR